jgi:Xaa-Pro aminopeptidase
MNLFSKETYLNRRKRLKQLVGSGILVFLGNEESSSNFKDNHYPFRQDSNFLYFFGLDSPGLSAIIDVEENSEIIFGDDTTIEDEVWFGSRPTVSDLAGRVMVTQVKPKDGIIKYLHSSKHRTIHILPPFRPENERKLADCLQVKIPELSTKISETFIKAVVAIRSVKSSEEIDEINKAVTLTANIHKMMMKAAQSGMTEQELVGLATGEAIRNGGYPSFPPIITTNGQILHNHNYSNRLEDGKMVLIDFGAETSMYYAGDITRTIPVSDQFSSKQKDVYTIVSNAHSEAIKALKPGVEFIDIHLLACKKLAEGLKDLGLMKGSPEDAVKEGAHALFFQCGLGHMMGLDVHDMEDLGEKYVGYTDQLRKSTQFGLKSLRLGRALEEGFVLTVEPGLYFIPQLMDSWQEKGLFKDFINYDNLKSFRNFGGIRIEDDFEITKNGSRLMGEPLTYDLQEVEAFRRK